MEVQKILKEFNELIERNRLEEAEQFLNHKIEEANRYGEWKAELKFLKELMKFYSEIGKKEHGMSAVDRALELSKQHEEEGSLAYGMTLLNAATAVHIFGNDEKALELYEGVYAIYEEKLHTNDFRFAGLYQKMGVVCEELEQFERAEEYFSKALTIMEHLKRGEMELAVTHINLAYMYHKAEKEEKVEFHLQKAKKYFDSKRVIRDGYYAHTCVNCIPYFEKLGDSEFAEELKERARKVYEGA